MFNPIRALARPLLASMFITGGVDAVKNPEGKAAKAKDITEPMAEQIPQLQQFSTPEMIRANGAVQVLGGTALAFGKLPRTASTALAATLIPTTLAAHRFWELDDPQQRANHQIHFFKNLSMLGGLLIAAFDREGKPSAAWRAHHAVEHVSTKAEHTKREAELAAAAAAAKAKEKKADAKARVAEAKGASKAAAKLAAHEADLGKKLVAAKAREKTERAKRAATPDARDAAKLVKAARNRG